MELQHSIDASTNLAPLLSADDHQRQLKSTCALRGSHDKERDVVLIGKTGQPDGQSSVEPKSLQVLSQGRFWEPNLRIDYLRATDEQLVSAAKSSDRVAFEELIGRHCGSIRRVVYRIVRNHEDAEDVVQETLLRVYCRLSEFRESCKFSTWVTKIAINASLMLLRKRKARPEPSLVNNHDADQAWRTWDIPDPSMSIERKYICQERLEYLSRAVERLPSKYRLVFELSNVQEKSMREAATMLGTTVATAKSRLFRARKILRSELKARIR
jgi:RNA polymerase sigma-70 factor, ECF subfamily